MKQLNAQNFKSTLQENTWALVDFYTTWCPPCKLLKPVLEELSKEMTNLNFYTLDIEEAEDIAEDYEIQSVPTLILFKNGNQVGKKLGARSKKELSEWLSQHLKS